MLSDLCLAISCTIRRNRFRSISESTSKVKFAWVQFSNNTDEIAEIDFSKIFLLDRIGNKYHIYIVAQAYKLAFTTEKYKMKLNAGKKGRYIIEFWPPYPKDEVAKNIEVNGTVLMIEQGE